MKILVMSTMITMNLHTKDILLMVTTAPIAYKLLDDLYE